MEVVVSIFIFALVLAACVVVVAAVVVYNVVVCMWVSWETRVLIWSNQRCLQVAAREICSSQFATREMRRVEKRKVRGKVLLAALYCCEEKLRTLTVLLNGKEEEEEAYLHSLYIYLSHSLDALLLLLSSPTRRVVCSPISLEHTQTHMKDGWAQVELSITIGSSWTSDANRLQRRLDGKSITLG